MLLRRLGLLTVGASIVLLGVSCKPRGGTGAGSTLRDTGSVCSATAIRSGATVGNFASIDAVAAAFKDAPVSPDAARKAIADLYGSCSDTMATHLKTAKPNVYVYITGFGGARQQNAQIDEAALMKWINARDPKALILSMSWDCMEAVASGDGWCQQQAARIAVKHSDPAFQALERSFKTFATNEGEAAKMIATVSGFAAQSQIGYNTAHTHSMLNAARIINFLLKANEDGEIGGINIMGYSMGAHSASEVLITDFAGEGKGFEWASPDVCTKGGSTCNVVQLKKVKWSLAMGLSGWADSMIGYNKSSRIERDQYENGGLLRIKDPKYLSKLNVLNRRMDPTGNADDSFQRAIRDVMLGDYNHYAHDYSSPLFDSPRFLRVLDAFVEAKAPTNLPEIGILYDNAGQVDFDDCAAGSTTCTPKSLYFAHRMNRSHGDVMLMEPGEVKVTTGVPQPEVASSMAADFTGTAKPLRLYSMDQEDLRGGIEMYFQPKFDPAGQGTHGLFSYGSCSISDGELTPTAYFEDGKLIFSANYAGKPYKVEVDMARRRSILKDKWAHLSFTWDLPTVPLTAPNETAAQLAAGKDKVVPHVATYGKAIIVANGLRRASATTFKEQKGQGFLRIYMNGSKLAEAPLGDAGSARECLSAAEVLNDVSYEPKAGVTYPPHLPYANYTKAQGDIVALDQNTILGKKCKAFKIRNEKVFFGCGKGTGEVANAEGYMDDIAIIFGPGRKAYGNVGKGAPIKWNMGPGVDYNATPFTVQ